MPDMHMGDGSFRRGYSAARNVPGTPSEGAMRSFLADALADDYDDYDRGYALGFAVRMLENRGVQL